MKEVLSNLKKYKLAMPITHILFIEPDVITVGESCLEAIDAKLDALNFWWHVEYPKSIKSLTSKIANITRKYKLSNKLISITLLESIVKIISYAVVIFFFRNNPELS